MFFHLDGVYMEFKEAKLNQQANERRGSVVDSKSKDRKVSDVTTVGEKERKEIYSSIQNLQVL